MGVAQNINHEVSRRIDHNRPHVIGATFNSERHKPKKREFDGHERRLLLLKENGTKVRFELNDGSSMAGSVVFFDRYSVTITGFNPRDREDDITIFKHSIKSFKPVK